MSDSPASIISLLKGLTPTFDTAWEDYERLHSSSTTDISHITSLRSALFTDSAQPDVDVDMNEGMPSPLSDSELTNILNLEAIEWAIEFTDVARPTSPTHPINDANDGSESPSVYHDQPSEPTLTRRFPAGKLLPNIYYRLRDAGSPFWAAVAIDIQHCTWAELSEKLCGREPTKKLFTTAYKGAISRQVTFSPTCRAGK